MRVRNFLSVLASLLVAGAALQFGSAPVAGNTDDVTVDVGNFFFDPEDVTIEVGDTVTWNWVGGTHGIETSDGSEEWCAIISSGTCDKTFDTLGTFDYRCTVHPTSMTGSVTVASPPPVVTILTPLPDAEVDGTIAFSGTAVHGSGIDSVDIQVDDGPFEAATVSGDDWTASIDTTAYTNGAHTLTARATSNDDSEASTSVTVTFANPATFDLTVEDVDGTTGLGPVDPTVLTATIGNDGNAEASAVLVRFSEIDGEVLVTIGEAIVDVPAGQTVSASITWDDPMRIGSYEIRVDVDPDNEVVETNEGNNDGTGTAAFWTDAIAGLTIGG